MQLSLDDRQYLQRLLQEARAPMPAGWHSWWLQGHSQPVGVLSPDHVQLFRQALPGHAPLMHDGNRWVWKADHLSPGQRGDVLQEVARQLHRRGAVVGWRNEAYSCWSPPDTAWPYAEPELFRLERAAFRFFGLRSHASHVHGLTPDGRMWCGRRALSKATDPGLLDNLAAGGLPADEHPHGCAVREILEEAVIVWTLLRAGELHRQHGVRMNCVSPGPVDTPILEDFRNTLGRERVAHGIELMGRPGRPDDIASVVRFLCHPDSGWIAGENIRVDGSLTASRMS